MATSSGISGRTEGCLLADLEEMQLSASVRLTWSFTPRLCLEICAQPARATGLDRVFLATSKNVVLVKFSYWWRP